MITVMPRCLGTSLLFSLRSQQNSARGQDHRGPPLHWSPFKRPNDLEMLQECHADDGAQLPASPNSLADAAPPTGPRPTSSSAIQRLPLPGIGSNSSLVSSDSAFLA